MDIFVAGQVRVVWLILGAETIERFAFNGSVGWILRMEV